MFPSIRMALSKLGKPTLVGLIAVTAAVGQQPALALDVQFAFNQNPMYLTFGTIQPDGTISYEWVPQGGGPARPVGDYEVEGEIFDLSANLSNQVPAQITISKASHDPLSIGTYRFKQGNGFDLLAGEIQRTFWIGELDSSTTLRRLIFTPGGVFNPSFAVLESGPQDPYVSYTADGQRRYDDTGSCPPTLTCSVLVIVSGPGPGSNPVFSPLQTLKGGSSLPPIRQSPGPLPVLAVAAGYQASRNLRRRVRAARPTHGASHSWGTASEPPNHSGTAV